MMRNILDNVRDSSSIGKFVFDLIEEEDPKFFEKLLADDASAESPIKTCSAKINLAKKQEYVNELTLKKTLSLATLTGMNLGKSFNNY